MMRDAMYITIHETFGVICMYSMQENGIVSAGQLSGADNETHATRSQRGRPF